MTPPEPSVEVLARAVREQAEAEAKKTKEAAQATAEEIIAEAEREASKEREKLRAAQVEQAKRQSVVRLAAARLEARRRILDAREELLDSVFAKAEERLFNLRKDPSYPRVLSNLVQEGVAALEGDSFVVSVMADDYDAAVRALDQAALGNKQIEVHRDDQVRGGGCIVSQADGRALYDNTLSAIVARHRMRARPLVAEALWGKEAHWDET
jgi:V/A-type H+-transporting ATPase subunit E